MGSLEPTVGIEPTTARLQNVCSTTELSRLGGAAGGGRTHTPLRAQDFKSCAYANSATAATFILYRTGALDSLHRVGVWVVYEDRGGVVDNNFLKLFIVFFAFFYIQSASPVF